MSRTRTRGSLNSISIRYLRINESCSQTAWTDTGGGLGPAFGSYETMTDEVIPGFHSRSAKGGVFFNPMSHMWMEASDSAGSSYEVQRISPITCSGSSLYTGYKNSRGSACYDYNVLYGIPVTAFPSPVGQIDISDYSDLVTELVTRVRSERGRGGSNLYESIAQMNQVAGALPSLIASASKVVKGAKRIRKSPKKGASDISSGIAESYLNIRYGLLPIMSDIHQVVEALKVIERRIRKTTRASGSMTQSKTETKIRNAGLVNFTILSSFEDSVDVRVMSLDEYRVSLAFAAGLSGKNLITLPWELVRLSFVIDWFVNVGDLIGSLVPSPGVVGLGGCVVVDRRRSVSSACVGTQVANPSTYTLISPQSGGFTSSIRNKTRSGTLPSPGLVIKNDFRLDNIVRAADAVSLLITQLRSFRK